MTVASVVCGSRADAGRRTDHMARIVRAEFIEMPGLCLSRPQFLRMWNLTPEDGERILEHLFETQFLCEDRQGMIRRAGQTRR